MAATRTVTYQGPSGRRTFTKDDGFTTDLTFDRGVPAEVSVKDAERLTEIGGFELAEGPRGSADKPDTEA
jgi:hypothetical protein